MFFFGLKESEFPRFDLIMLGLGEDGHTASLFPGNEALNETRHLTAAVKLAKLENERITLTLPVINNARNIVFLTSGKSKAGVLKRVLDGDKKLPAALVKPKSGKMFFMLDKAAAKEVNK